MSFKKADLFPCNPATTRGEATRLSASKDKIAYTNGRTVIVRGTVFKPTNLGLKKAIDPRPEGTILSQMRTTMWH